MNLSREIVEVLGKEKVLRMRVQEAKGAVALYLFLALGYPLLLLAGAYLIRAMAADGTISVPSIVLDAGVTVGWLGLVLLPAVFIPRALRNAREFDSLKDQLFSRGGSIDQKAISFRMDNAVKRYVIHSAIALGIFMLGKLIDGNAGTLLEWMGLAGIVLLGVMIAFSGDVVIGAKDKD